MFPLCQSGFKKPIWKVFAHQTSEMIWQIMAETQTREAKVWFQPRWGLTAYNIVFV